MFQEQECLLDEMKSIRDSKANDSSISFQAGTDLGQEVIDLLLKEKDDKLSELELGNQQMAARLEELTVQLNDKSKSVSELQLQLSSEQVNL